MKLPGFVGPSNVLSSTLEDCELSVNLYPETGNPGTPKEEAWLSRRPGLRFLFSVGSDPVECLFYIDGRAFGIAGTVLFEWFANDTYLVRGTVAHDGLYLATMCSNGHAGDQIMIVAGSKGYIYTLGGNVLTQITDPDFEPFPVMCEFFGGYFLVLGISSAFRWSALEDGTSWDALDVAFRSWAADDIVFIKRYGTHIWLIGQQTSEVWYATGGIEVFGPAQESLIEHGSVARFTGQRTPQGVICLDQDERGVGQVVMFRGLQPDSISTYAINLQQLQQAGNLNHAFAYAMQMQGHVLYVVNNATGTFRLTPVFDATEQLWHHWAHWDATNCVWVPFRGQCHASAFERHYIGDRLTGAVYEFSPTTFTDELAVV